MKKFFYYAALFAALTMGFSSCGEKMKARSPTIRRTSSFPLSRLTATSQTGLLFPQLRLQ